nr:Gfo/Idh/MocA family oxidoreductase [Clostridia bacterium]
MSFRFVILGAGLIAAKFADAIRRIEDAEVIGVGSRSMERAAAFAGQNGIPHAGSYEEMLALRPDAAYVAATTEAHAELTRLCIAHGVPVLCEKAMFTNSAEAEEVFAYAREKGVFAMEAMWSRFLPANVEMKKALDSGAIGEVKYAEFAIGWQAPDGPRSRFYQKELGGGAAYDLLVYCYELAEFYLGVPEKIENISVRFTSTGVDETETVTLRYPGCLCTLSASLAVNLPERAVLHGTKGTLMIAKPHFASEYTLALYDGATETWNDEVTENGFVYEAQEVMRCVKTGLLESPVVPHELTLRCARIFDVINAAGESHD